ncbi:uncharacterized protein PG998_008954 [Apiospora kogelbergensis]|uniref:uncharacterized protein n=1 Tax=Apiospora kogelbergensis TaxID=1337665 RepID=UPI003130B9E2
MPVDTTSAICPKGKEFPKEEESYISPLNHLFRLEARLFIAAGSLGWVYEPLSIFVKQMMEVEGNQVHVLTYDDMPQNSFLTYSVMGTKEACAILRKARTFLSSG